MIPLLFLLFAQVPAPAPSKCTLEGTAVSATTGAPLKKVSITLEDAKSERTAITSVEGKFKFENLEPGDYTMKAERIGYLELPDAALTISPAGLTRDLKLTPQGIISGRVLDDDGDPVLGVRVAYIRWVAAGDKKFKLEEDAADVNGEGGFTITGLSSGNYYLQALPDRITEKPHTGEDFAITFYPNSLDLASAGTLTVTPGGEVRNLEIRMRKSPKFRVRGKVSLPAGAAGIPTELQLVSQDSAEMSQGASKSATINRGEFRFDDVQPGSYLLRSSPTAGTRNQEEGEFSWGPAHFFFHQPVEVSDHDIDGLTVSYTPAVDLTGRFIAEGMTLTKTPAVILLPVLFASSRDPKGESDLTGAFRILQLPPDRFQVVVANIPPGAYVKSVRYGGQEIKGSLDLTSGGDAALEITLAPNAAEIAGTLRDAKGTPLPHRIVNLWSSDDQPAKVEQTASDGSFAFRNVAPGDYHVAAWDTGDHEVKPNFRKLFENQSAAIAVHEGSHENADVKLIVPE